MSIVPKWRVPGHEVWVTVVLFFCLLLFAWVRMSNPKKIPSLVTGFFRGGTTEEKTVSPASIGLFIIFICTSVLLIMRVAPYHGIRIKFSPEEEFLVLGLALLGFYLVKTVILVLCGFVFEVQPSARDYANEIFSSVHLAAIVLFPAAIIVTFAGNINEGIVEKILIAAVGLFLLFRTIKMFIIMTNRGFRKMYLFLYLCAFEIIPWVLLYEAGKKMNF